ncbi:MAG: restriction endonuclease [Deltaproteobacteria bacterium]|nr:restriction endonuclease [Deltaproteobacteria bacterium]
MSVFFVIGFGLAFGFFLIFLIALSDRKRKIQKLPESFQSPIQFYRSCLDLIDAMKLELIEKEEKGNQIDIMAQNPAPITGGLLLIRGLFLSPSSVVEISQILEFSSMVLQERVTKGIFITTGEFSPELKTVIELAPIEFIDGKKFLALREKYYL